MKRYKARPGKRLRVGLQIVTDDPAGVELTNSPTVRENLRHGRLLLVEVEPATAEVKPGPEQPRNPTKRSQRSKGGT